MNTKWRTLFILFFTLLSFKARAATYNFNFYNDDKDEKKEVLPAISPAPTIPLAPLSSTEVTTTKEEENLISLGLLYYVRDYKIQPKTANIKEISGYGIKIATGKKGGLKLEGEGIREASQLALWNNNENAQWDKIIAYGAGLNLKKEFMASNALGFEFGLGGNYLKGKSADIEFYEVNSTSESTLEMSNPSNSNKKMAWALESGSRGSYKISTTQYSYYASVGLNIYLKQFSLGLSGKLGKTSTHIQNVTYEELKINSLAPTILTGLSYSF